MPRQARIQSETGYYHIMLRGNNRENIFNDDKQKSFFIEILKKQDEDGLIDIVGYCIMDNHVHIVLKSEFYQLIKAVKSINIKYAIKFNQRLDRVGHVFQDRYKSEAITDDKYLLQVIRYIHNNPVKAKMVKLPEKYIWSSYNEYILENTIIKNKQKEFIMSYFNGSKEEFKEFHIQKDDREYLEMKEEILDNRMEQAQNIISAFFAEKGLTEANQVLRDPIKLEEIIQRLLNKGKLSHRQIARLVGINSSVVHKVSKGNE